jgi:outer membrane protein OmpA-like peptidoglycan-associated protein
MVIEVHGHADATGSADVSRRLSKERALAVAKYLIAAGVEAHRLVAIGHGADAPIVTGDAQESMTCNRRIEFSLQRSEGGPKLSEILRGLH